MNNCTNKYSQLYNGSIIFLLEEIKTGVKYAVYAGWTNRNIGYQKKAGNSILRGRKDKVSRKLLNSSDAKTFLKLDGKFCYTGL